jgi:GDP-L-fucose synthase
MVDVRGSRILVTGATGFLGQYVAATLAAAGAQIFPVSRTRGFDLRYEAEALSAALVARPDILVHAAGVREDTPLAAAFRDTLQMGMNVVHAAAVAKAKLVLIGRHGEPGSIHHGVRQALTTMCRAYRRQHDLRSVILVPCDLYGPYDHHEPSRARMVSAVIGTVLGAKAGELKDIAMPSRDAETTFPLLFVEDAARAVAAACDLPGCDEPLFLSGEGAAFRRIVDLVVAAAGWAGKVAWSDKAEAAWTPAPEDGIHAREVLEWRPATGLEDGLRATVQARIAELAAR